MGTVDVLAPVEQEGTKASVARWLKAVGEAVTAGEPLVELETDKVVMEVPAPAAGTLAEVTADAGADAAAGTLLGRIAVHSAGAVVIEQRGAPATAIAGSPAPGVDHAVCDRPDPPDARLQQVDRPAQPGGIGVHEHRLAPGVRRQIAEHGLDPTRINGTGRGGRITRSDVEAALAASLAASPSSPAQRQGESARTAVRDGTAPRSRTVPHTAMRRRIAERMATSLAQAPHVTAVMEADFSAVAAHRAAHKAAYERDGVPLTYTAYLVAAAAQAMAAAPQVNARWHDDALEVFDDVNVGVGTALGDEGLIVPVVHRAQQLNLMGIAARLGDLTARARSGHLRPGDVAGGTFTISNHGVSGTLIAAPIILVPGQTAILGVGKLEKRVVVRQMRGADALLVKPMAYISLTIDHRALDGATCNAWLTRFIELLEGWPLA
ncbi:MAG: 2-oxo acid dehydrogenase subunit E2 [Sphingomonadaceae bacterium]|nr:2-oxo acid dehydrogenase subunit E2 [Sphingomonadaceae bacterium]